MPWVKNSQLSYLQDHTVFIPFPFWPVHWHRLFTAVTVMASDAERETLLICEIGQYIKSVLVFKPQ